MDGKHPMVSKIKLLSPDINQLQNKGKQRAMIQTTYTASRWKNTFNNFVCASCRVFPVFMVDINFLFY